ncbi:hypothetical protein GW7_21545 [Heterocephalus glaber]|uniref:Uncharacterized protein n=1 Tax=Heterocephalus glaber TaxID=10181 RepID=G5BM70_HETGA|nr:hypothetical protein GW7_21545 [Heterocephalus glaber]
MGASSLADSGVPDPSLEKRVRGAGTVVRCPELLCFGCLQLGWAGGKHAPSRKGNPRSQPQESPSPHHILKEERCFPDLQARMQGHLKPPLKTSIQMPRKARCNPGRSLLLPAALLRATCESQGANLTFKSAPGSGSHSQTAKETKSLERALQYPLLLTGWLLYYL